MWPIRLQFLVYSYNRDYTIPFNMLFLFQGSNFGSICFMVKFWQQTTGVCTCAYSGTYILQWEYVHVYFSSIVVHVYLSSWGEPEQAPHALRTCVYMFVCGYILYILNERYKNQAHALEWLWKAIARVQRRFLGIEMTEVESHMASYSLFAIQIINSRLPTGSTNFDHDGGWSRFR